MLATSLRPLQAADEQILRVLPFVTEMPESSGEIFPAVLVFAQKAVASDAGFSLGRHNLDDVATICREVGGLPLAIELAASRCAAIPVAVMASQLARPRGSACCATTAWRTPTGTPAWSRRSRGPTSC